MMTITVSQLVELAQEAESKNPIEWGEIPIDEYSVYNTFATAMLSAVSKINPANKELIMLASIVKLQSENFALSQHNKQLLDTIRKLSK